MASWKKWVSSGRKGCCFCTSTRRIKPERKPYYMTEYIPEGVEAHVERTRRALKTFKKIAENFEALAERLDPDVVPTVALPKEFRTTHFEYLKALNKANEEEAKLATQYEKFNGIVQGGALDLAEARAEILKRVTRMRERGGS